MKYIFLVFSALSSMSVMAAPQTFKIGVGDGTELKKIFKTLMTEIRTEVQPGHIAISNFWSSPAKALAVSCSSDYFDQIGAEGPSTCEVTMDTDAIENAFDYTAIAHTTFGNGLWIIVNNPGMQRALKENLQPATFFRTSEKLKVETIGGRFDYYPRLEIRCESNCRIVALPDQPQ